MKKVLIISAIFLMVILSYFVVLRPTFTGNIIEGTQHTYTKAICDQTTCEDYYIECLGKKLTKITFTGHAIENKNHPIELIDENRLCD